VDNDHLVRLEMMLKASRISHYRAKQIHSSSSKARKKKKILDDLSNSVSPFDYIVKAGQPARRQTKE
jgi:hypothetical protein